MVADLLDARDASLAHAIVLARALAAELERYETLGGEIGVRYAAAIEDELSADLARMAVAAER